MYELDHVFLWCAPQAPEADRLLRAGLRVGRRRRHTGQGTANACFGFGDAMLELIWIADAAEAAAPPAADLHLLSRADWRRCGACPIGVAVRGRGEPPFSAWDYAPPFLPPGRALRMAANHDRLDEPLLFSVPQPYETLAGEHPFARKKVRQATVTVAGLAAASPLCGLALRNVRFRPGGEHLLELVLEGDAGFDLDCRPDLPLVLRA